tara:strand:- start:651 stop:1007 length:357 start_codon:yes stop_codon:yes gene_type:complete
MEKVIRYVGIADCHGIESLQEIKSGPDAADKIKQEFYNLQVRAMANPQRLAVTMVVGLTEKQNDMLNKHLNKQNTVGALRMIKNLEEGYGPLGKLDELQVSSPNNWKKIPNPKLDPYG